MTASNFLLASICTEGWAHLALRVDCVRGWISFPYTAFTANSTQVFYFLWKWSSTKMFLKNNLACYAFFSILSGEGMLDVSQSSPQTRYKLGFYVFVLSFSPHLWELKTRGEKARKGRENKETGGERNKRFNLCKDLDIRKSSACVVFTRSGRK